LALNSAPVIVTTTSALTAGTYTIIAKAGSATGVTGTPGTLTVNGSGTALNTTAALSVVSGQLILTVTATGTTITSTTSGNWSSTSTWIGGVVPIATDNVVIANTHTVILDGAVTREAGTTTTVNSGGTLAAAATLTNNGTVTVNGAFQLNPGGWATGTNFVYGSDSNVIFNNIKQTSALNNFNYKLKTYEKTRIEKKKMKFFNGTKDIECDWSYEISKTLNKQKKTYDV